MPKDNAELIKKEIELRSKIAGASAKENFYSTMTVRLLKGMDRFNPSKRKEYRDIKKFIKTIEKRTKEASSNKEGYIQQLQELDKQLKQGTLRNFEQIRGKSKEEIAILPDSTHNMNRTPRAFEQIMGGSKSSVPLSHSTPNMDRPPALPPRVGR
ncbi:BAR domain-containing protein [Enterococcus hirae]|uniref:hypothetical protein n=1 Tax=Enterococcus hirae TaxID=1354 RepID=UPI0005554530|nr:hypothetical protein [Enterococcus hirae]KNB97655.1 hypothetical protein LK32_04380 [Enterococcus hirae]MCC1498544.1 hypothetical protein [Enterococcus hirae]MCD5234341.1 hypothetical protein [Enterococcus hirae]GMB99573.1 hypothetical protein K2D_26530 [Enterococcus hirae]GMC05377.1 hypothetical protein K4F_03800 [Enterococcus hirae]